MYAGLQNKNKHFLTERLPAADVGSKKACSEKRH